MARRRTSRTRRPLIKVTVSRPRLGRRRGRGALALFLLDLVLAFGLARSAESWRPVLLAVLAVAAGFALVGGVQAARARRW